MSNELHEEMNFEDFDVVDLVLKAVNGDEMAYSMLYKKFFGYMRSKCVKFGVRKDDHEDLIQDTFMKVFAKIKTITPDRFAGYDKMAILNTIKNYITKKIREEKIFIPEYNVPSSDDDETPRSILEIVGENPSQRKDATARELELLFQAVLKKMTPKLSNILVVVDFNGYSYKEAAQMLTINEKNVGPQLHRARKQFKKLFKKLFPGCYDELL